jgi:hypothetical protein
MPDHTDGYTDQLAQEIINRSPERTSHMIRDEIDELDKAIDALTVDDPAFHVKLSQIAVQKEALLTEWLTAERARIAAEPTHELKLIGDSIAPVRKPVPPKTPTAKEQAALLLEALRVAHECLTAIATCSDDPLIIANAETGLKELVKIQIRIAKLERAP